MKNKKLTPEEFATKATDILFDSLSKLPPEEQDRRLDAFEKAVNRSQEENTACATIDTTINLELES